MDCRGWLVLLLGLVCCPGLIAASEPVLLFPENTAFQFTVGTSVPIAMDKKGGIVFSSGFQFNYMLPWNLTQLEPMVVLGRQARQAEDQRDSLNLENIYTSLENLLEENGWGKGRECLLRTICELAETPLERSGQDVVEEIIHLLLTRPSEDSRAADYSGQWSAAKLYEEAERLGSSNSSNCALAYAACAKSPLDSFTEIAFR